MEEPESIPHVNPVLHVSVSCKVLAPVVPFPFFLYFGVLLKLSIRMLGTILIIGLLGNLACEIVA